MNFLKTVLFGKMDDDSQDDENAQESKGEMKDEKEKPEWKKYETMDLKEKRKLYKCRENFVLMKDIKTWPEYFVDNNYYFHSRVSKPDECPFPFNEELNEKVSLWTGDITTLEIDAIVNAANQTLLGGGGVDGCIHRAAGPSLKQECRLLKGCETGQAKLTSGHKLPAKFVLHTVGPVGEKEDKLESCYNSCLELCLKHEIRTVAFCCISTGIFGYPNEKAAEVALRTSRSWLEKNKDAVDRIIFCLFMEVDIEIYQSLMMKYFPPTLPSPPSSPILSQTEGNDQHEDDIPEKASKKQKQDDENVQSQETTCSTRTVGIEQSTTHSPEKASEKPEQDEGNVKSQETTCSTRTVGSEESTTPAPEKAPEKPKQDDGNVKSQETTCSTRTDGSEESMTPAPEKSPEKPEQDDEMDIEQSNTCQQKTPGIVSSEENPTLASSDSTHCENPVMTTTTVDNME
ncbi:ADP-ribose glycohydrolase MACROD2 [Exaiptasia diaphana]|uniref:Macro domain-containing protein n=1 Tax=Exaiptasia diaphana TaxID=2652724 RepID=A0A913XKB9_EXADI|nr:ADP-ribose glycohydrolase MACROD2 [Exaiptasia diaphana]KXJ25719.1 O-acetyl-ADP-ribose deacetylase MACROD2 [Exaiptasia diaphana]